MSPAKNVSCPAVLDLASAPALKELLVGALADEGDIFVDGLAVTQADTACLQILCAAAADLGRAGRSLTIAPSPALTRVAERLGLALVLGLRRTELPSAGTGPRDAGRGT